VLTSAVLPMLIVHVVRQFAPSVGGLEDVVRELSRRQAESGFAVRVVTLDRLFNAQTALGETRLPAYETMDGVEIIRVPYRGSQRYPIAPRVLRYIRAADIVHVHGIDFFFDFLALTKPFHGRRMVASTHGGFFHTRYASTLKSIWFRWVTSMSMRAYAGVAAVSNTDFERFKRIRRAGLYCIENGVNIRKLADMGSPSPAKSMICVGRLSTNKRLDRLIAWMNVVRQIDPDWSLIIAGRPWDQSANDIQEIVARFGQEQAISVLDTPTDEQIGAAMARSSIFVSASEYEGFGIAAVEGLSAGLYPVLSDIGAFRSLVTATGVGTLIDFTDLPAAAHIFLDAWDSISQNYRKLRQASVEASRVYDWGAVSDRYLRLYKAVLGHSERSILDVPIQATNKRGAFSLLEQSLDRRSRAIVAFGNANLLNIARRDSDVRDALRKFIILNDGIGVDIASRVLFGAKFPENLNGTDFVPYVLSHRRRGERLFLLGARPGVAERAASALLRQYPQHDVVGVQHGYGDIDSPEFLQSIRSVKPDVILVALGNPAQELWLARHFDVTGCTLGIAVGALFDFMAGESSRAPRWVRSARLEWAYRLALEPRRMASRYVMGIPSFLARVLLLWWSGVRGDLGPHLGRANLTDRVEAHSVHSGEWV
jgi:alpha-1,3-mannosyltransferase